MNNKIKIKPQGCGGNYANDELKAPRLWHVLRPETLAGVPMSYDTTE